MSYSVNEILQQAYPVMPVLAVQRVEDARPLAEALKAGGLKVLEVTLRTEAAIDVIAEMKKVEGVIVGAGTVTRVEQLKQLEDVGADFAISPGATPRLLDAGLQTSMPFLPAVASVSEMMQGMELGYTHFKFFPAAASGGVSALKAFAGPFPDVRFCPTGGISVKDFRDYLALGNVACVGGSWIVPADALNQGNWGRIEQLAREACELAG
ncbi:keto-deoxy-phosphogluconate aldolase [Saccharospirillum sp. MSK14-1]|uniref:bifunctional 4-hydroxy-2-oxoglutarate aldolase/2-dehydro-3-deoxy-phosphogluconate aldolase n=1 Tax=Saccharospirillum sp. MSK14-1 TaxID=1897632 RepID=UPI000D343ECC|nr:bifunctional 4-hydroxy-2-oxoglutarate aldolase/2-dehydro-3-deoxy-phosphogluconate aldolase [Saccharospirillum sp. MSK14-1]PTY36018.1 keto-deoxy-phosphogluconate aldolase [Saccharospirillum sp. MSK14-1]